MTGFVKVNQSGDIECFYSHMMYEELLPYELSPESIENYYWLNGSFQEKKEMRLSVDNGVVSHIPKKATIYIVGQSIFECDDGFLELSSEYPTVVSLRISAPNYKTKVIEVNL